MSFSYTYTLQDLFNVSYSIIKQPQNSTAYDLNTFILPLLNKAQNDICYWKIVNLQTWERLEKFSLPFLNKTQLYTSINDTTLSATAILNDTTLYATTDNFPSSWYLWIEWSVISYAWKTATTFTWCSAIPFPFASGTRVKTLYQLPTDLWQINRIFFKTKYKLKSIDQHNILEPQYNSLLYRIFKNDTDLYYGEWYYSIIDGQYLLCFLSNVGNVPQPIRLEYQRKPTQLVASNPTSQTLIIPDDYSLNTIPYMATSEALMNRQESAEWIALNNFAFNNIKSMYSYYNNLRSELMFDNRLRTSKDGLLNI